MESSNQPKLSQLEISLTHLYSLATGLFLGGLPFLSIHSSSITVFTVSIYAFSIVFAALVFISKHTRTYLAFLLGFSACLIVYYTLSKEAHSLTLTFLYLFYILSTLFFSNKSFSTQNDTKKLLEESRNTTRKVKRDKERLIFLNKEKSRFIANASHDLKQPLHALGLYLDAINKKTKKQERAEIIEKSNNTLKTLDNLFSSLLDMSNIDSGEISPSPLHVELYKLLNNIQTELTNSATENKIELTTRVHPELIAFCDPILLSRCLKNIISNSISLSKGSSIQVTASTQKNNIQLSISDNGKGISEEEQKSILEGVAHTNNMDESAGSRIGLNIAKKLLNLQEHSFKIESINGKGTTFRINIPFGNHEYVADLLHNPNKVNRVTFKKSILVIEDNPEILEATGLLFKQWKQEVFLCTSVTGALDIINSGFSPEIIVSDYKLKDNSTGADVIEALRHKLTQKTQIIFISGEVLPQKIKEIRSHGYPLIHKPLRPATLESILTRLHDNPEYGCLVEK